MRLWGFGGGAPLQEERTAGSPAGPFGRSPSRTSRTADRGTCPAESLIRSHRIMSNIDDKSNRVNVRTAGRGTCGPTSASLLRPHRVQPGPCCTEANRCDRHETIPGMKRFPARKDSRHEKVPGTEKLPARNDSRAPRHGFRAASSHAALQCSASAGPQRVVGKEERREERREGRRKTCFDAPVCTLCIAVSVPEGLVEPQLLEAHVLLQREQRSCIAKAAASCASARDVG